jgi:hypothetical protein
MEMKEPNYETIVTMVENAMTLTDNAARANASKELSEYENQFPIVSYASAIADALLVEELINQAVIHLRVCVYLKEYLK